jgi:hypothetical protein
MRRCSTKAETSNEARMAFCSKFKACWSENLNMIFSPSTPALAGDALLRSIILGMIVILPISIPLIRSRPHGPGVE